MEKKMQQRVTGEEWRLIQAMRRGMLSPAALIEVLIAIPETEGDRYKNPVGMVLYLWNILNPSPNLDSLKNV